MSAASLDREPAATVSPPDGAPSPTVRMAAASRVLCWLATAALAWLLVKGGHSPVAFGLAATQLAIDGWWLARRQPVPEVLSR